MVDVLLEQVEREGGGSEAHEAGAQSRNTRNSGEDLQSRGQEPERP